MPCGLNPQHPEERQERPVGCSSATVALADLRCISTQARDLPFAGCCFASPLSQSRLIWCSLNNFAFVQWWLHLDNEAGDLTDAESARNLGGTPPDLRKQVAASCVSPLPADLGGRMRGRKDATLRR